MAHEIEKDGWEVCAHRHTPMGNLPEVSGADEWQWGPASIPFDAISWLSTKGGGPNPLVSNNDLLYRWTEDFDWVLRKKFCLPDELRNADDDLQILINNLDCYFDLFVNRSHVGKGRNQFREHVLDLDDNLLHSDNELLIYIRSARNVNSMMEAAYGQLPAGFDTGRVHARRSQCLTGWDWTARLSSVSLLSAPVIRPNTPLQLLAPHAYVAQLPTLEPGQEQVDSVQLHLSVDLQSRRRAQGNFTIRILELSTGATVAEVHETITIKPKTVQLRRVVELKEAKLWWSLGMGAQPLYRAEFSLHATDRLNQEYDLQQIATFGVRTVTMDRTKDDAGESFIPTLNGVPVFCRGANWIPSTILAASATPEDYRQLLAAAAGAGMNCLRVWGGGIYETEEFYQLCDEGGILVWQDFMFACAAYPTYREFLDEVEAEVIYQVSRLRNHPCILLWCGNNENEWLHQTGGLKKGSEQKVIGETIWTHVIRQVVEDYDSPKVYHQSSPFGKNRLDYNDQGSGDRHSWEAWADWQHTDTYLQDQGRFISEVGFQSLPVLESIREFAPSADSMNNTELTHHQKMIEGQERLARYVAAHYAMPATFEEWPETTQRMQSEILRRAVEHWRRRRFDTAGVLLWQLHDAYPAISWSIIDFYRRPKESYAASRRFFAPVLLSMELLISGIEASSVPPEMWPANNPETVPAFPVHGGDRLMCEAGTPAIQARFVIVNDTAIHLAGELTIQFLRSESEPVVLDTVPVEITPNGLHVALTHDIGASLLKDIHILTVRAHLNLDENSATALHQMGESIRQFQSDTLSGQPEEILDTWKFKEGRGLELTATFVEPKYFAGTMAQAAG